MRPREEQVSEYFQSHYRPTWEGRDGLAKGFWEWSTGWEASGRGTCQHKECGNMKPCYQRMPFNRKLADGKFSWALFLWTQALFTMSLIFSFWVQEEEKFVLPQSRNPSDLHCLSTVCPSPAMFPQHSYKTLLRVSAVMRKKVDPASYGWSGRICHCSSPTDWISIKHLHMKKKIWLWLREWLKCILDTHRTPCDALLPLAHADAFFQGGAFFEHHIPAAVGIPGPHTGTEREREREREEQMPHRDTKVYGNINQLRGDKRRAEVKRSCNDKSNFPLWKHTVH